MAWWELYPALIVYLLAQPSVTPLLFAAGCALAWRGARSR